MELFAKFKKILQMGVQSRLKFSKFKMAQNPLCRISSLGNVEEIKEKDGAKGRREGSKRQQAASSNNRVHT